MAIELISVPALLASPRYKGEMFLSTRLRWSRCEDVALKALCESESPLERSAISLGRAPTTLAHRASGSGLILPREWRDAITIRRKLKGREPTVILAYPYITKVRGEHADLLAVNALVPRYLPDQFRADVCQEIMLAIWMNEISLEELRTDKALMRKFTSQYRKQNSELGGYALSLDVPLEDGRSWYDVLPDPASMDDNEEDAEEAEVEDRW